MTLTLSAVEKRAQVARRIRESGGVVVALSGGVDSAVLLSLAVEALGASRVLAVTGSSPAVPAEEVEDARRVAAFLGVEHQVVLTSEFERPGYTANRGDRCYHCRGELFDLLAEVGRRRGLVRIAFGAIAEDLGDYRPGMEAARERGVLAPLLEAGFTKDDVRAVAREQGLPVRDKPASACLASRIPVGVEVTVDRVGQVGRAEAGLKKLGFSILRVRHHGEIARLELDATGWDRLSDPVLRAAVAEAVHAAGFRYVAIDLEGYRQGSMNPVGENSPRHGTKPARESGQ